MVKVSIIGVGRVGSLLTYFLVSNPKIDKINLIDVLKDKVEGTRLDISHAYPEFSSKLKAADYSDVRDSDIVVICVGKSGTPKTKSRMELLDTNKKAMLQVMKSIGKLEDTIMIILTNPVEPLTYLAYKLSGLKNNKVIGFSNILDSERLKFILNKKQALVIGEHGEGMIPVSSYCEVGEKELNTLKNTANDIIKFVGSTTFGPARHLSRLITAIINDDKAMFPVSSYIEKNDFYEIEDVCLSLPSIIGRSGIEGIVKVDLNKQERKKLKALAEKIKKIQKQLLTQP